MYIHFCFSFNKLVTLNINTNGIYVLITGLSGNKEGISLIIGCEDVLRNIVALTKDTSMIVRKEALLCLINILAEERGALAIIGLDTTANEHIEPSYNSVLIENLIDLIIDPKNKVCLPDFF